MNDIMRIETEESRDGNVLIKIFHHGNIIAIEELIQDQQFDLGMHLLYDAAKLIHSSRK